MATKTKPIRRVPRGTRSLSPFGATDDKLQPLQFEGSPDELNRALEASFNPKPLPVKKKLRKVKRKDETPVFDRNRDGVSDVEIERARHLITNVVEVPRDVRIKFARKLRKITNSMSQFLLLEVAPFEAAIEAALADASESFRLITGSQTAELSYGKADAPIRKLMELKTIDWVCSKLELPDDIRELVLADYMGTLPRVKVQSSRKELHELQPSAAVQRPNEKRGPSLSHAQLRFIGRSIMEAVTRNDKNRSSG